LRSGILNASAEKVLVDAALSFSLASVTMVELLDHLPLPCILAAGANPWLLLAAVHGIQISLGQAI
jgi:hypothetical protein